jgi:hypothetical protein
MQMAASRVGGAAAVVVVVEEEEEEEEEEDGTVTLKALVVMGMVG